jgi:NitT/TauT family transport system substrate-binding protein
MSRIFNRLFPLLQALLAITLFSSGCRKELPVIRVGMNLWPGYEFLYLAKEKGYFLEEGINLQLYDFVSLSDSRRAFERGQIDVLAGTVVEMLIIRENSYSSPQVFYVTDFSNGADVILGRKPVQSITELKEKRVGVEPASLDLLTINLALKKNGMTLKDVTLVPMAQNEMDDHFNNGSVDAICTYPPTSVKLLNKGNANRLFDSSQIPGYIVDILMADGQFISQRADDLAKVILGYERALQFMNSNPEEALNIMAGHEQISAGELETALKGVQIVPLNDQKHFFQPRGQIFQATENALDILRSTGVLQKDLDAENVINHSPMLLACSKLQEDE